MSTPDTDRTLQARIAAHASWANTPDRTARTAAARRGFEQRFYDEVDPDRTLPEDERERRAGAARTAHFLRLARKSAAKRRANRRELETLRARYAAEHGGGAA